MTDLLFDPPWYLIVGLLLAGAALLFNGLSRGVATVRNAGVAAVAAAVLVYAVGRFVETGDETVRRLTGELVAAADRRDWPAFKTLLDPKVRFYVYDGREALTNGAKLTVERVDVKNISVGGYETKAEPGGYQVAFTATADIAETGRRTPTNWRFYWAKSDGRPGYLMYRIEALPGVGMGTDPVMSRLATP